MSAQKLMWEKSIVHIHHIIATKKITCGGYVYISREALVLKEHKNRTPTHLTPTTNLFIINRKHKRQKCINRTTSTEFDRAC